MRSASSGGGLAMLRHRILDSPARARLLAAAARVVVCARRADYFLLFFFLDGAPRPSPNPRDARVTHMRRPPPRISICCSCLTALTSATVHRARCSPHHRALATTNEPSSGVRSLPGTKPTPPPCRRRRRRANGWK